MHPYLYPGLELGPKAIERLIAKMSPARWDEKLDAERFSPREAVAHLLDWEVIMRDERLAGAVNDSGCAIEAYDEGERADIMNYGTWDPVESAAKYRIERTKTVEILRDLGDEDWAKFVIHPERGEQTIYDMANLLLGHDLYHLEDLVRYVYVTC